MEDDATGAGVTLGVDVIPTPSSALAPSSSTLDGISDAVSISDAEKQSDRVAQQGSTGPQATDSLSLLPGLLIDQYSVPEFHYGRPVRQTFCGHYLCTLGHGVAV